MLNPGLYLVATPIGNLQDLSPRAIDVLRGALRVYAEDTRHSQKLLNHFDIQADLRSLHQHNEVSRYPEIKDLVEAGNALALITDAGTPGISDPGAAIVSALHDDDLSVYPVPGASSLAAALSVSGFDHGTAGTLWHGFLPQKQKARRDTIERFDQFEGVVVFLESPHRIQACAKDLADLLDDRALVVCRELTKKFETVYRTTCEQFVSKSEEASRGELTLVLGPKSAPAEDDAVQEAISAVFQLLDAGLSAKDASKAASIVFGVSKKILYNAAIERKA